MKVIFKIQKYYPDDKTIEVKLCRLHSHKPIDQYGAKVVSLDKLDLEDYSSFVDSLCRVTEHRINVQDENELILNENEPNIFDDEIKFNIDSIIGKVFQGKFTNRSTRLLKMRRVKL